MDGCDKRLRVLLICNNAFVKGNGLCTAVQALRSRLISAGVDARLMACVNEDPDGAQPDFPLEHFIFPIFEPLIYANGFRYARTDKAKMREAIGWADVVHIHEGFPLEITASDIARQMGKPLVGTFHLYPENITANLGMMRPTLASKAVLRVWRDYVYDKCSHIQCPTEFVRRHLLRNGFSSELRTISNGIDINDQLALDVNGGGPGNPVKIVCIGRLSNDKQQITLLKAMRYSRHAGNIQLLFAGRGPHLKRYQSYARKLMNEGVLKYRPEFGFYDKGELARIAREAYLYIHCAWVEVEGLSCVEALREGVVPVIAEGSLSAASQFAIDERSTFPVFDSKALAARIDWWIEHPREHSQMRIEYARSVSKYDQKKSIRQLIQMYHDAIDAREGSSEK